MSPNMGAELRSRRVASEVTSAKAARPERVADAAAQTRHAAAEAFVEEHLADCVQALERAGVLEPGELESLTRSHAGSAPMRMQLETRHSVLGARALEAVCKGWLREEHFNVWSGRRKGPDGRPVTDRFEKAFALAQDRRLLRRRGALTGIIRAFQRLGAEMADRICDTIVAAQTYEEFIRAEREAIHARLVDAEYYHMEPVNGWPYFVRASGRLRQGSRVRELLEEKRKLVGPYRGWSEGPSEVRDAAAAPAATLVTVDAPPAPAAGAPLSEEETQRLPVRALQFLGRMAHHLSQFTSPGQD
jgi:hypothetical protein